MKSDFVFNNKLQYQFETGLVGNAPEVAKKEEEKKGQAPKEEEKDQGPKSNFAIIQLEHPILIQ